MRLRKIHQQFEVSNSKHCQELAEQVAIHDEKLVKEYQALVRSFLYLQVHTFTEVF